MKRTFTLIFLLISQILFAQVAEYYQAYVITGGIYSSAGTLNLNGTYTCGSSLILNGGQTDTKKGGGCDITGSKLFYRIYPQGSTTKPAFSQLDLPFKQDFGSCFNNSGTCQRWEKTDAGINLLNGLKNGTYTFEYYFRGSSQFCSITEFYNSNFGANYFTDFTVSSPISIGSISSNPTVICQGGNATLTVATQSGGDTYYWEKEKTDGTWEIVSTGSYTATIPNLTVSNLTAPAKYRCRITNCGGLNEAITTPIPLAPQQPAISTQPVDAIDCHLNVVNFYVSSSTPNVEYQWERNTGSGFVAITDIASPASQKITGTATNYLTIDQAGTTSNPNGATYRCVIKDKTTGCTVTSSSASLLVNRLNSITVSDNPVCEGKTTTFTPVISLGLSRVQQYQWYKSSLATGSISGATNSTYTPTISSTTDTNWGVQVTFSSNKTTSVGVTTSTTCTRSLSTTISITARPTPPTAPNQARCGAGTVNLTASATLGGTDKFRWYADNTTTTILQESTSTSYTTSSLAVGTYTYYVSVYNSSNTCESTRTPITVTVNPLPTISLGSVAAICPTESSFSLPYSAITNAPNQYTITATTPVLANFVAITDAVLPASPISISIPANAASGTYPFSFSVKNSSTTCESVPQTVNLTIKAKTQVVTNPTSQEVCEGEAVTFSASGTGEGTLSYQWRKNGTNITDATSSTYKITATSLSDAGNYDCVITAECGSATTTQANLVVYAKAKFTTQPINKTVCREDAATFTTAATGTGILEYRWKKGTTILTDGTNIAGSTTHTLTLTNLQVADAGDYICEVKGDCDIDFVASTAATLTVNDLPLSPTVTSPVSYCKDATATALSATATGTNTLLWYGLNATGGTSSTTAPIPSTTTSGTFNYYVAQKDANGCESSRATVIVNILNSLTASISGIDKLCSSGTINTSTTLTASSSGGDGNFTYQWKNSAGNISSATNSTYTVTNANQSANTETYTVVISSGGCVATSQPFTVSKIGVLDISITGNTPDICGSGSKTISIVNPVSGSTYKWFADATITTELATGTTYTTPTISTTTSYYAVREFVVSPGFSCQSNRANTTIIVHPIPAKLTLSGATSICTGTSTTLTASGCSGTIKWSNGSSGSTLTVNTAGSYTATCTENGCESPASDAIVVNVNQLPTITLSAVENICFDATTFSLPYSATTQSPTTYSLTSTMPDFVAVTDANLSASPISVNIPSGKTGTYTFTLTVKNASCVGTAQTFSVTVLPTLNGGNIKVSPTTIYCAGINPTNLTSTTEASGGKTPTNYQWESSTDGTNYTDISGQTASSYDPPALTQTTYYRRKVTDACGAVKYSNVHQITVVPDPVASITASTPTTICSGETVTFAATLSGGTGTCTTKWQSSLTGTLTGTWTDEQVGGTSYTTSALTAKKYFRVFYDCDGSSCNQTTSNIIAVTVNPLPTIPTISGNSSICQGNTTTLTATNCNGTIQWSNGNTTSAITVSSAGSYSATCSNSCGTSEKSNEIVVNVTNILPPTISGTTSICSGQSATLTATGCGGSINWSNGGTGTSISVSPTVTTSYTATCTVGSCTSIASEAATVSINQSLDFSLSAVPDVCNASTTFSLPYTITLGSADKFDITSTMSGFVAVSNSNVTSSPLVVSIPSGQTGTQNFSITMKNSTTGCSKKIDFSINILPVLSAGSIEASSASINCAGYNAGEISSMNPASGGKTPYTYQWESSTDGTVFSEIASQNGLAYDPPALTQTTYFRRKVLDACGGISYSTIHQVTIVPDPQITIVDSNEKTLCSGQSFTLQATVAGGSGTCLPVWQSSDSPTGTFTVEQTDGLTLTKSLPNTSATPLVKYYRAVYSCSGTGSGSCNQSISSVVKVTVNYIPPSPTVSPTTITVCSNQTATLVASGCSGTITWSNGSTGSTLTTSTAGSYSATCTVNQCESLPSSQSVLNVSSASGVTPPTISADKTTICVGESITLTANGCSGVFNWSNGSTGTAITVTPSASTNFTATCTDGICTSAASNSISTLVKPVVSISVQPQNQSDCKGNSVSYSVSASVSSGTLTYQWQRKKPSETTFTDISGATNSSLTVSNVGSVDNPHLSEYRCVISGTNICGITSNSASLFVNSVAGTLSSKTICEGTTTNLELSSLTIVGSPQYQWQKYNGSTWENLVDAGNLAGSMTSSLTISSSTTVNAGNYRCKLTFSLVPSGSCIVNSDDMTLNITSKPLPPTVSSPISYCQNSVATALVATASTGNSLLWYNSATGGVGSSTAIVPPTTTVGTFSYFVSQQTANQCESERATIQVIIRAGIAQPINTTPATVTPPATLTFSASTTITGGNLLWYNSATSGVGSTVAPSYSTSGIYRHWVSQTDPLTGCESPRLEIVSEILNPFRILTQPQNQADCAGNSVNMSVAVAGSDTTFTYQWQRKRPNESEFANVTDGSGISNSTTNNLRVSSVGNTNNPNLSQYRCLISDGASTLTSEVATLYVNDVIGSLSNISACLGGNTSFNLSNFTITGTPQSYQWQTRAGTSGAWTNLTDGSGISGSNTTQLSFTNVQFSQGVYYRCVVKFNTLGVICEEPTDPARLDVGGFPPAPTVNPVSYCQYATASKLKVENPNSDFDYVWYTQPTGGTASTTAPTPSTAVAGTFTYYVGVRNQLGCESQSRTELRVTIYPQPAAPINTTQAIVNEGQVLTFSATGENLRWYTTPTVSNYTTASPTFTAINTYTRYVAQVSQYGCVSPRTVISAAIIPSIKFTKQPASQADCEGNSVTFSVSAAGYGVVQYQWQRLLPTDFIFADIPTANTNSLKINNIGDENSPNGTKYRCVIKDDKSSQISSEANLIVNEIKGTFKPISICSGIKSKISLKDLTITGNVVAYQWQKKSGSSYADIPNETNATYWVTEKGTYRTKISFATNGSTCPRYTPDVSVEANATPTTPQVANLAVCQNVEKLVLTNQVKATNKILWYESEQDSTATFDPPSLNTSIAGKTTYFVSQISEVGCESKRVSFDVIVSELPAKPLTETTVQYCRYSTAEPLKATTNATNDLVWYNPNATTLITPITTNEGEQTYWVSAKNKAGCESEKVQIKVSIGNCYADFAQNFMNCLSFVHENLNGNSWFDIYDSNGQIYASVNPNGQNLGKVTLSIRHYGRGEQNIPKTLNGTHFMARYVDLQSSLLKTFDKPVSVRIFYQNDELQEYKQATKLPQLTINDFNIVHYDGVRENCGFEDNDNFINGNSYVIYKNVVAKQETPSFFSLMFEVNEFSENGATANVFSNLTFDARKFDENTAQISWQTNIEIKGDKFIVQRSENGKTWTNLGEIKANGASSRYELPDYQPLGGRNLYRLIFVDKDGTKKIFDPKEVIFEQSLCQVFPNPIVTNDKINLYTRNIKIAHIKLIDMLGKEWEYTLNKTELGINQLRPQPSLSAGTYFIVVTDEIGKKCLQKFVVNP